MLKKLILTALVCVGLITPITAADPSGPCVSGNGVWSFTPTSAKLFVCMNSVWVLSGSFSTTTTFLLQTANLDLPNAQALSALSTGLVKVTTGSGVLSTAAAPADFVATSDSRLSDARTPTAHASSHKNGGSDEVASAASGANLIPKAGAGGTLASGWISGVLSSAGLTNDSALEKTANKNAASGYAGLDSGSKVAIAQVPTGSTSSTVAIGNDARLSDARTPVAHAASHLANGSDPIEQVSRVTGSNATTTGQALVDVTGLSASLVANATYTFEGVLSVSTTAVTTGTKYGVNFSAAGATVEGQMQCALTAVASMITERVNALNTANTTACLTTSAQSGAVYMRGIVATGANAGSFTVKHLKVTSGTSTVFINSFLRVVRIG